jgi:hypothetical protein
VKVEFRNSFEKDLGKIRDKDLETVCKRWLSILGFTSAAIVA